MSQSTTSVGYTHAHNQEKVVWDMFNRSQLVTTEAYGTNARTTAQGEAMRCQRLADRLALGLMPICVLIPPHYAAEACL